MNLKLISFLVILIFVIYSSENKIYAEVLSWKKVKFVTYESLEKPEGKIIKEFISPDKKYSLFYFSKKDTNKYKLYLKKDTSYNFIDEYQEIKNIKWSDDSSKVYFEAIKELNYTEISYWKVSYLPKIQTAFSKVLKINK